MLHHALHLPARFALLLAALWCIVFTTQSAASEISSSAPTSSIAYSVGTSSPLLLLTEDYAPFNYVENDTVIGIFTEIIVYALDKAQIPYTMRVYPWARALQTAKSRPNTILFAASRTPEREKHFTWIGPVAPYTTYLVALRDTEISATTLIDLRQYKLGLSRGYASADYLAKHGFKEGKHFELSNSPEQCLKKLLHGRVDLTPLDDLAMAYYTQHLGYLKAPFNNVFKLFSKEGYYFAVQRDTDPTTIARLRATFAQMEKQGTIATIVERYRR